MKENNYTIVDKSITDFGKVTNPKLYQTYHLSWAYKGAKFSLYEILDDTYCMVHTGKTNNKLLKVKLSDLRHLKGKGGAL